MAFLCEAHTVNCREMRERGLAKVEQISKQPAVRYTVISNAFELFSSDNYMT